MFNPENHVVYQHGSIKVLNAWAVLVDHADDIYGEGVEFWSTDGIEKFTTFCEKYDIHYYARPGEDFFKFEAYEEAEKAGKTYLVMENLS